VIAVWEVCDRHQIARAAGDECRLCAIERLATPASAVQRDVLNTLEARIADLEAYVVQLRTQVIELQRYHRGTDAPRG